jgi:hypothetical protein
MPSIPMILEGQNKLRYFSMSQNNRIWFKSVEEYAKITRSYVAPPRDYHPLKDFEDFADFYHNSKLRESAAPEDKEKLPMFLDFMQKFLRMVPNQRMTPKMALNHPFIKNDLNEFKIMKRREKAEAMLWEQKKPAVYAIPSEPGHPGVFNISLIGSGQLEKEKIRTESSCAIRREAQPWFDVKPLARRRYSCEGHPGCRQKNGLRIMKIQKGHLKAAIEQSSGSTESSFKF